MAGIKITELPSLAEAANDDLLYIVDVSTDASKKITIEDINQNNIPLSGTTNGNPISGDLEVKQLVGESFEISYKDEFNAEGGLYLNKNDNTGEPVTGMIKNTSGGAQSIVATIEGGSILRYVAADGKFTNLLFKNDIEVNSSYGTFAGIKYANDFSANYENLSLITRQDAPALIKLANTPCDDGHVPTSIGDFYINTSRNELYQSFGTSGCSDWKQLFPTEGGEFQPILDGTPPLGGSITLNQGFYTMTNNVVNVKFSMVLLMGALHSYTIDFSLPTLLSGNFSDENNIIGSITPSGGGVNKLIFATTRARVATQFARIILQSDLSLNGNAEYIVDFQYKQF